MSTIGWIIVAIVVIVVVIAALAVWRSQHRRKLSARADALRVEAREHTSDLGTHRRDAREAAVRADEARAEAEQAQREADNARTALAQEEASHEDKLREADRLDPEVDHKAADYQPDDADRLQPGIDPEAGRTVDNHPAPGGAHRGEG